MSWMTKEDEIKILKMENDELKSTIKFQHGIHTKVVEVKEKQKEEIQRPKEGIESLSLKLHQSDYKNNYERMIKTRIVMDNVAIEKRDKLLFQIIPWIDSYETFDEDDEEERLDLLKEIKETIEELKK